MLTYLLPMKKSKKDKTHFVVQFIILITVIIFTAIQIIFKEKFISADSQIVSIGSWFFGLTVSAMIPGLIYKGGKGYNLVLGRFTEKEKAFGWFILELLVVFLIVGGLVWLSHFLFSSFYQYTHLLIIEWILLLYIWFSKKSSYKFPWFYTIVTNIILIIAGYFIYGFY